jgi:cytochrome c553
MRIYPLIALAIPTVLAFACGGAPTPATPDGVASAVPSASIAAPAGPVMTAWKDDAPVMEQVAFMKANIQPHMGKLFQDHDAKKYADFSCATCHGPNKENPHKFLPKLKLSGDGFPKLMAEKPEMTKWMHEVVEPEMAKSMGQQPYDMKTNTGFGCKGCHAVE